MKRSHLSIAIILIASTAIAWHNHQQLVSMRARNAQLAEEVALLGASSKTGASRDSASSTRDRTREDAEALAAEFIAFASEVGKMLEAGISPDAQTAKETADLIDRIITLTLLALAREAPATGTVFRIYVDQEAAKLQYSHSGEGRMVSLWDSSPVTNNQP
jgi:NTP pyrophosphatase (non-canonical NTP hydrolase)